MEIDTAIDVLQRASIHEQVRLRRGALKRAEIAQQLANGVQPSGPRIDWLLNTSERLIDTLAVCANEFNESQPDDLISEADLADALTTALSWLRKKSKSL